MSNFRTPRLNEDDSQSSDEKMDTGSESFRSQDTPNSLSDFEDKSLETNVLRLQNPEDTEPSVLRLSEPTCDNIKLVSQLKTQKDLNNSLVTKMSNLTINTNENRPQNLGISPPKFSSSLVLTTNHPLMGLGSPEFPDVIPKLNEEKDLSLSSIEDERQEFNSQDLYSPQINTSKNNLYFSENFTTAESFVFDSKLDNIPPDVARVEQKRRKIIPKYVDTPKTERETSLTPHRVLGRIVDSNRDDSAIHNYIMERNKKLFRSTPKSSVDDSSDVSEPQFYSGVSEWPEPPSPRPVPKFDLPIELSANVTVNNDLNSPDVISSSTQEDKSAYEALLDPYTGNVALRHTAPRSQNTTRRKIQLPPDEDRCSLDSLSVSMDSEEEPPEPEFQETSRPPSGEASKRSKSSQTGSECSELIPEYSAVDELRDERSWLRVSTGGTIAIADMKVIEPYKRVISHGGYDACGAAIIVFSACHLPDQTRTDYGYVMDNLFLYVIWTLNQLVTDEYVLVYLHGSAGKRMPSFRWLQECYKLIDRRLRKSLKHLYLVHPTFWLKSIVILTKPFVSSKFFRKLSYVRRLAELAEIVPVEPNAIPEMVKQFDARQ